MILVTGATGQLGHLIVQKLLERVPAERVGVSVRDPARASSLAARGVRVRRGDFADPASLGAAFAGSTQVLLVSSNAAAYGGHTLAQHRAAIEAARSAGVRRVVYTSQMASSPSSLFSPAVDHAATEQMLRESGLAWTALRNGFYASSALQILGMALATGVLETSGDGPIAWTTHDDLAEAAALTLLSESAADGPTASLTAPQALDFGELCALATETLGRPIEHRVVTEEQLRARMSSGGVPATAIDRTLGLYRAAQRGEFSGVTPALATLLGRAPRPLREVMAEKLRAA